MSSGQNPQRKGQSLSFSFTSQEKGATTKSGSGVKRVHTTTVFAETGEGDGHDEDVGRPTKRKKEYITSIDGPSLTRQVRYSWGN